MLCPIHYVLFRKSKSLILLGGTYVLQLVLSLQNLWDFLLNLLSPIHQQSESKHHILKDQTGTDSPSLCPRARQETSPATSTSVTGTILLNPMHDPEFGKQILPLLVSSILIGSSLPVDSLFCLKIEQTQSEGRG